MKTVVSVQDLLEREIKPNALLAEYFRLTESSVDDRWADGRACVASLCPGCGGEKSALAFTKMGFSYRVCERCQTLFVSPRPDEETLTSYYRESDAARFWREQILPTTADARQEKLAEPRAYWILDTLAEYLPTASRLVDVSAFGGPVAEVLLRETPAMHVVAAHAVADLDYTSSLDRVEVRPGALLKGDLGDPADAILAFDVIDRTANVSEFVQAAHRALRPGGLLFVTASSVSGFDLQVLWERSSAILPPDRLNVLSVEGWLACFGGGQWEVLELSTPGMFDVENVRRAVLENPDANWPRFIRTVVAKDETARVEFQAYLQQFRLASFARLVVRRAS